MSNPMMTRWHIMLVFVGLLLVPSLAHAAAELAGSNLTMAGSVRRDTAASSAGTTGNNATINTDATGRLWSNTELPDASSTPNSGTYAAPTAPDVWAFLMCKSGSTYDPCPAAPNIAHDAAASSANPSLTGGYANATAPADVSADLDAVRAWFLRNGAQVTANIDPCSQKAKIFLPISQTTGTQLFTGTASNRTYVCQLTLQSATAQNIVLVSGTGTVCATSLGPMIGGTTAATGFNFTANQAIVIGTGASSIAKSDTDADNICILMSSTGQLSGVLSYVVAPN